MLLDHFLLLLERNEWNADYSDTVINALLELCIPEKLAERVTEEFEGNRCVELMTIPEIEFWDKIASKLNIKLESLEDYKPYINERRIMITNMNCLNLDEETVEKQYLKIKDNPFKYPIAAVKGFCKHYDLPYDFIEVHCISQPSSFDFDWELKQVYNYGGCFNIIDYTGDEVVHLDLDMDKGEIFYKDGLLQSDVEVFECVDGKFLLDFTDYPCYLFLKKYGDDNPLLPAIKMNTGR